MINFPPKTIIQVHHVVYQFFCVCIMRPFVIANHDISAWLDIVLIQAYSDTVCNMHIIQYAVSRLCAVLILVCNTKICMVVQYFHCVYVYFNVKSPEDNIISFT